MEDFLETVLVELPKRRIYSRSVPLPSKDGYFNIIHISENSSFSSMSDFIPKVYAEKVIGGDIEAVRLPFPVLFMYRLYWAVN